MRVLLLPLLPFSNVHRKLIWLPWCTTEGQATDISHITNRKAAKHRRKKKFNSDSRLQSMRKVGRPSANIFTGQFCVFMSCAIEFLRFSFFLSWKKDFPFQKTVKFKKCQKFIWVTLSVCFHFSMYFGMNIAINQQIDKL